MDILRISEFQIQYITSRLKYAINRFFSTIKRRVLKRYATFYKYNKISLLFDVFLIFIVCVLSLHIFITYSMLRPFSTSNTNIHVYSENTAQYYYEPFVLKIDMDNTGNHLYVLSFDGLDTLFLQHNLQNLKVAQSDSMIILYPENDTIHLELTGSINNIKNDEDSTLFIYEIHKNGSIFKSEHSILNNQIHTPFDLVCRRKYRDNQGFYELFVYNKTSRAFDEIEIRIDNGLTEGQQAVYSMSLDKYQNKLIFTGKITKPFKTILVKLDYLQTSEEITVVCK